MKPGDHPEFFRFPAPEGRSRESTIRLDPEGHFWHEGNLVEHAKLAQAMHGWVSRHPDDGRYILTNGYDWTYFTVEDAPYFVRSLRLLPEETKLPAEETNLGSETVVLELSDGTEEPWDPGSSRVGANEALYAKVKRGSERGAFDAKFTRFAQSQLAPVLVQTSDGESSQARVGVRLGGRVVRIGA